MRNQDAGIRENGLRTVGKSTLLSQLAERLGRAVIDCDDPATSALTADLRASGQQF
jgi:shikimate kinase